MKKEFEELERMMEELRDINQELDAIHRQMTQQLMERIRLLEKLVTLISNKPKKQIVVEKAFYRYIMESDEDQELCF